MMQEKSKSPLALMEQAIMILVFALAAALCVQVFVQAELMSRRLHDRDLAANFCQTVAETVKVLEGDYTLAAEQLDGIVEKEELVLYYNKEWKPVAESGAVWELRLVCLESGDYLTKSELRVTSKADGELLFSLPVSWQEVAYE